ncbi:hypothetical protein D3C77_561570 [compost metagenome]
MGIFDLVGSDDHRTERRISILTFRIDPLTCTAAIPGAHIDHQAVAEDMVERVLDTYALGGGTHDHGQFDLPVQLTGNRRVVLDCIARADYRGRRLGENHRFLG